MSTSPLHRILSCATRVIVIEEDSVVVVEAAAVNVRRRLRDNEGGLDCKVSVATEHRDVDKEHAEVEKYAGKKVKS